MARRKDTTLATWWLDHAHVEAQQTVAKMTEYGAGDLIAIGHKMAQMTNGRTLDDDQAFELGVLFYLIGKVERVVSATERGEQASDDTWFDIAVYAKMTQARRAKAWK